MEARNPAESYLHMRTAMILPISQRIRTGYAIVHTMVPTLPKKLAIEAVDRALRDDPYGPVPLYHGIIHYMRDDRERARELLNHMKALYPKWQQTMDMEQLVQ